jgi:hypothetical protein
MLHVGTVLSVWCSRVLTHSNCRSPHGRFLCIAGFGNLAGEMDFYDTLRGKKIGAFMLFLLPLCWLALSFTVAGCICGVRGLYRSRGVSGV